MAYSERPEGLECTALWQLYNILRDKSYLMINEQLYYVEDVTISVGKQQETHDLIYGAWDIFHRERINIYLQYFVDDDLVFSEHVIEISTICNNWRTAEQLMAHEYIRIPSEQEIKNAEKLNVFPIIHSGNKSDNNKNKTPDNACKCCTKVISSLMRSLEDRHIPYSLDLNGETQRINVNFSLPGDPRVSEILKTNSRR